MRRTVGDPGTDAVVLAYDDLGAGSPPLLLIHGIACHRGFWREQVPVLSLRHRVLVPDLRGHGESDAPEQRYTVPGFADDLTGLCRSLGVRSPVAIGHSLGGLVALQMAACGDAAAAVMIDSVLVPGGDRTAVIERLVADLSGPGADHALRDYFQRFFVAEDDPALRDWVLEQARRCPVRVPRSVWEESLVSFDDAAALARCRVPLLYLDAGTPNADLERAGALAPQMRAQHTTGCGHFSPLAVPDQINAALTRFLATLPVSV